MYFPHVVPYDILLKQILMVGKLGVVKVLYFKHYCKLNYIGVAQKYFYFLGTLIK